MTRMPKVLEPATASRPVRELEGLLEKARQDPDVIAVLLFGSAARGEPYRDIDVALVAREGAAHRRPDWDMVMGYSATLPESVDLSLFEQLPVYIQTRVLGEGKVLWCRDEDELYEVAFRVVREWEDFRPFYEHYLEGAGLA